MDIQEIRDLLEKAKIILRTKSEIHRPELLVKPTWKCIKEADYTNLEILIDQALTLLKQPKCKTCGDSKEILQHCDDCKAERGRYCRNPNCKTIPCPKCQQPSELTKKLKRRLPNVLPDSFEGMKSLCATLTDTVKEACSIIDSFEQQPKAREYTKKIYKKWSPAPKHTKNPRLTLALIDLAEAIKTDLLEACETALPFVVAHDIQQEVVSGAALKIQAAIAKAKRDRE